MSYSKCYFHPKTPGADMCRGCKLPVCADCHHETGFCPDCTRKRGAVDDLRQLRKATQAKSKLASSTTARLRLAIRQVGPIARRGRLGGNVIDPSLLGTSQLRDNAWQADAMAVEAKVPAHVKEVMTSHKKAPQWTYDPDRVAYRGLNGSAAQPTHRARVQRVEKPTTKSTANTKPFIIGLALGLAVVLLAVVLPGLIKGHTTVKSKPIYSSQSAVSVAIQQAQAAGAARRERANARKAVLDAAFAEASATVFQAERKATRTVRVAAIAPAAPAPVAAVYQAAAPVVVAAAPVRATYRAPRATVWHRASFASRSIARAPRAHRIARHSAAPSTGGMLTTAW